MKLYLWIMKIKSIKIDKSLTNFITNPKISSNSKKENVGAKKIKC